jgi:hypothetical protein
MSMIGHDRRDVVKAILTYRSTRICLSPPSSFLTEIEEVDLLLSKTEAYKTSGGGCLPMVVGTGRGGRGYDQAVRSQ